MSNSFEQSSRAGYTNAQQKLSEQTLKQSKPRPDETRRPRYGVIVRVFQKLSGTGGERIEVEIRFDNKLSDIQQGSYNRGFILNHTPEEPAMLYGDKETLIGKKVVVHTSGDRQDQGVATIVNRNGTGNIDKANMLKPFGTLLAPAGTNVI